jgi:phosphoglycolate phosphatase-like HAD superfamily hydrolase
MQRYSVLFDIEGTLVDSVPLTLTCWRETLAAVGYIVPRDALQRYSGMDGADMLKALFPEIEEPKSKAILKAQAERFARDFLGEVKPFPGLREVLRDLADSHVNIALATDCKGPALQRYRQIMDVDDLVHAIACGDDVEEGKPNPSVIATALSKLNVGHRHAAMVGDTPYDAQAAA